MSLLDISPEILVELLKNLGFVDLLKARLVCRALNDTIINCAELQYIIELASDGMVNNVKCEGTHRERLAALLVRRERWEKMHSSKLNTIKLPRGCDAYDLVAGVFLKLFSARQIVATWLPSRTDAGHQLVHMDIGLRARDFAADPSQDLIAYLEEDEHALEERKRNRTLRVHIRSLLTNAPHSDADVPILQCVLRTYTIPNGFLQIVDDVVGVVLRNREHILVVWNWRTGALLVVRSRLLSPHPPFPNQSERTSW
jgi:hypothetical protein